MLRRDIFNLLFAKNANQKPVTQVADPVIATPGYLMNSHDLIYFREWAHPFMPERLIPEFSANYAFTLTLTTKSETAILSIMGIDLGLKNGCLFIGPDTDHRMISIEKFRKVIKLVLTVNPQPNGASYARLMAIDQSGLTLSLLKSKKYPIREWLGAIIFSSAFCTLQIDGLQPNKNETKIT